MRMNKSQIKALICIFKGDSSREQIAKSLKVSENRLTPLLKELESLDFISIERKNRKLIIKPSNTQHSHELKNMLILEPGMKYESFLYGLNFRILSYCLYSEKPIKSIAQQLGISQKTVLNRSMYLRRKSLLKKNRQNLSFNKKNLSSLYNFLSACRRYTKDMNNIVWKFEEEVFFESEKNEIQAEATGFSGYSYYKIPVFMMKTGYYAPKKKMTKEEVFIHSLLQIRGETRLLEISAAFFYKNQPNKNKLLDLAYKYDCISLLNDFFKVINAKTGKIKTETLPLASADGIAEMCRNYGAEK